MKNLKILIVCGMFAICLGLFAHFSLMFKDICYGEYDGSAISINSGAKYTISGGTITSSKEADFGGGIYVDKTSTLTISGGTITANSALKGGGGIYSNGTINFSSGTINGNTAGYGAGVANNGVFTISGGTISGNTVVDNSGGGIYTWSSVSMSSGYIQSNSATYGGGVYIDNRGASFTLSGGTISGNTASNTGAGVYAGGTLTINSGYIQNNTTSFGGGVYVSGTCNMYGGTVSGNTAKTSGGGFYVDGTLNMSGGSITGNSASYGSAVYIGPGGTFNYNGGTISGQIYINNEEGTTLFVLKKAPTSTFSVRIEQSIVDGTKVCKLSGISTVNTSLISLYGLPSNFRLSVESIDGETWVVARNNLIKITVEKKVTGGGTLTQTGETFSGNFVWGSSEGSSSGGSGDSYSVSLATGTTYERISTYCVRIGSVYVTLKITKGGLSSVTADGSTFSVGTSKSLGSSEVVIQFVCYKSKMLPDISIPGEELEDKLPKVERGALFNKQQAVLNDKKFVLEPVKDNKIA